MWGGGKLQRILFFQRPNLFEKLFSTEMGGGYPAEWASAEQRNRSILTQVKKVTHNDILSVLKNLDQELLKGAIAEPSFRELFYSNCKNREIMDYIRGVLS